jgi:hypothetical protein
MNPWLVEEIARDRDAARAAGLARRLSASPVEGRPATVRWFGRALMRAGARLAGVPSSVHGRLMARAGWEAPAGAPPGAGC